MPYFVVFLYFIQSNDTGLKTHQQSISSIYSQYLEREVTLTIILPVTYQSSKTYKLLLLNDGQDIGALGLTNILDERGFEHDAFITVGIHANHDRVQEYGTAGQADYADRGTKALNTTRFVLNELIPFLSGTYSVMATDIVYAGFSLGGLMALDIVWAHPDVFSKVGVFSGALWWRQKALNEGYEENDRIMHARFRNGNFSPGLQFWFQCGTDDETDDRDQDGVIDSIQDTLECIAELERKGYGWKTDICYVEVKGGEHNVPTWATVMPGFLQWAFPERNKKVISSIW